jgi:hypothetical protein
MNYTVIIIGIISGVNVLSEILYKSTVQQLHNNEDTFQVLVTSVLDYLTKDRSSHVYLDLSMYLPSYDCIICLIYIY